MPRKIELTWLEDSKRWKKKYKGRLYYFAYGTNKRDLEGYQLALDAWHKKKDEIDQAEADRPHPYQDQYDEAIREWSLVLQWSAEHHDQEYRLLAANKLAELREQVQNKKAGPPESDDRLAAHIRPEVNGRREAVLAALASIESTHSQTANLVQVPDHIIRELDGSEERIAREVWSDRLESQRAKADETERADTVAFNIDSFLKTKRQLLDAKRLSAGRYDHLRRHLGMFRDWIGGDTAVATVSGKTLVEYHSHLMDKLHGQEFSAAYAKDYLDTTKMFVRWCWQVNLIEDLPRNIDSKALQIGLGLPGKVIFTVAEVKKLLKSAPDRLKLYMLLMLNCGTTQKDISDLKPEEVDWRSGIVKRKRSKTSKFKNVPIVSYKLWKTTFRLLKQERSDSTERVLLSQAGTPLKVEAIGDDGKLYKIDSIGRAFNRHKVTVSIDKPLKSFRKTSSSLLAGSPYPTVAKLFLDHVPREMDDKHYIVEAQNLLNKAVIWLGRKYGIE